MKVGTLALQKIQVSNFVFSPLCYSSKCKCVDKLFGVNINFSLCFDWRQLVTGHFTTEAWVQSQVRSCEICSGQSGLETSFSFSASVFLWPRHWTSAPYSFIYHWYYIIWAVNSITEQHTEEDAKCSTLNLCHFTLYKFLWLGCLTSGFKVAEFLWVTSCGLVSEHYDFRWTYCLHLWGIIEDGRSRFLEILAIYIKPHGVTVIFVVIVILCSGT